MKKTKNIKVNALAFHQALELLKTESHENAGAKGKRKSIQQILIEASDYLTSKASIPVEVKIAILKTDGVDKPDPADAPDDKEMADFDFSNIQYIRLTERFNNIAASHNQNAKSITVSGVQKCDTVKDCIDLVTKAAS